MGTYMARFAPSFRLTLESALVAYSCLQGLGVFIGSFPLLQVTVILPLLVFPNQVSTFHYWSFGSSGTFPRGMLSVRFPSQRLICQLPEDIRLKSPSPPAFDDSSDFGGSFESFVF